MENHVVEESFYILRGFGRTPEEYFYSNYNVEPPLVITEGMFGIPSSAIKVAGGLWKQET
jgi:hypothetical protein